MESETLRDRVARAAGWDAGNRSMLKAGRTSWNRKDYNESVREYHRINPCPADVECLLCNHAH